MLYDPKWEKPTKAKPFSRAHVIAWLETKNPTEAYCYIDNGHCLIGQYLELLGHTKISVSGGGRFTTAKGTGKAPRFLYDAAIGYDDAKCNRTFGGALRRVLGEPCASELE